MLARPRLLAALLIALALFLTACSGGSTATSEPGVVGTDAGGPAFAPGAPAVPEDKPTESATERQVARTASLRVQVEDPATAAARLRALAAGLGGMIVAEYLVLDDADNTTESTVVLQVPADKLDQALDQFATVGTVLSRSATAEDVTDQVVDVDARVRTLRASIARLEDLMKRAGTLTEITALEGELTNRQAQLESMLAQQKALQGRVQQSTVTVSLLDPQDPTDAGGGGFLDGLASGWRALVATGTFLLTALGALLPFGVALAVVALPLGWWLRRRAKAKREAS